MNIILCTPHEAAGENFKESVLEAITLESSNLFTSDKIGIRLTETDPPILCCCVYGVLKDSSFFPVNGFFFTHE